MIKIVIGKPGTGKTYHTVRYIIKYLEVQSRKDNKRKIYTNISLNLDEIQKYCDRNHWDVRVDDIIIKLSEDDLKFSRKYLEGREVKQETRGFRKYEVIAPSSKAFFWNRIEDRALIIIDEIQKYIGSIKEYGESERQSLVEYFSLHRHKKHDWIFLTQSLMSLSVEVRRVSEQVDELFNIKTMTLPFPLSIPVQDVFTVLRAFGVTSQVYRVRSGYLENSYKVCYEGPLEVVKMSEDIFKLYQTHTLLKEDSALDLGGEDDLPYELGKGAVFRALRWFVKKHAPHLLLKFGVVSFVVGFGYTFIYGWKGSLQQLDAKARGVVVDELKNEGAATLNAIESDGDEDSSEREDVEPDQKQVVIITNNQRIINGISEEIGKISPITGDRVVSISPRKGVFYEDPKLIYYRDFLLLSNLPKWLRQLETLDESAELSEVDNGRVR